MLRHYQLFDGDAISQTIRQESKLNLLRSESYESLCMNKCRSVLMDESGNKWPSEYCTTMTETNEYCSARNEGNVIFMSCQNQDSSSESDSDANGSESEDTLSTSTLVLSDSTLTPIQSPPNTTSLSNCFNPNNTSCSSSKHKKPTPATICTESKHPLVKRVALACGMKVVDYTHPWDILWCDYDTNPRLRRFQRTNQFPFISELCHKKRLAKNLQQMETLFPDEYKFFPKTWVLPRENIEVAKYLKKHKATLIVKPDLGSNGEGIALIRDLKKLPYHLVKNCICQVYIANPFLIDGFKFDIRIYTLLTSSDPLRIYTHADGLVRFATVKYEKPCERNLSNICMHLTNYALNKSSRSFIRDDEVGSKRKISTMNAWFTRNGYDINLIWERIDDVIVKSILAAAPSLKDSYNNSYPRHNYRTACFQLLGFDILLDGELRPYVIEVNHSPSFHTDTSLDLEVKEQVLRDTFLLCNLTRSIRAKIQKEERIEAHQRLTKRIGEKMGSRIWSEGKKSQQYAWEKGHMGRFRLLYPCLNEEKYHAMCLVVDTVPYYKDTVASIIRTTLGKAQRDEIEKKQTMKRKLEESRKTVASGKLPAMSKIGSTKAIVSKLQTNCKVTVPKLQATNTLPKLSEIQRLPQARSKIETKLPKIQSKHYLEAIYGPKKKQEMVKNITERNRNKSGVESTSRTFGIKNGNGAMTTVNHQVAIKVGQPFISKSGQQLISKSGQQLNSKSGQQLISKSGQQLISKSGQHLVNSILSKSSKKSVVPTIITKSIKVKQIDEDRTKKEQEVEDEEIARLEMLKERHKCISLLGLDRMIYFAFKESDNLSPRDVQKYKYLEKMSVCV